MNELNNKQFSKQNLLFTQCCDKAKTEPTKRQASKFRQERGLAYEAKATVIAERKAAQAEKEASNESK